MGNHDEAQTSQEEDRKKEGGVVAGAEKECHGFLFTSQGNWKKP